MANYKKVGKVEKLPYGTQQFEWEIPHFFTIVGDRTCTHYVSPSFSIAGTSWHFRLYPNWYHNFEFTELFFYNKIKRGYLVEYNFGLKICDGSTKQLLSGILKGDEECNNEIKFINKAELVRLKSELVPGNVLTIICTVKLMTEITALDAARHLMLIRLDRLSENFKDLFGDKETCDTILKVKDREYMVHRTVLIARSSVFAATFKYDTLERQAGVITISDCDPDSFQKFREYLYCGKLEDFSLHSALNLYYTSNKYDVEELKAFCVEYLMQCLTVENVCEIAAFAKKYEETQLFKKAQDFFNKHSVIILLTSEWENLWKEDDQLANTLLREMARMKHKK